MANPMLFLLLDVRQAVRQCGARPGFTLAVLIVLAVGIGANATTFILARGLLLRPLPYPDSEAIVSVGRVLRERPGGSPPSLSNTELRLLWDDAQSFEQLAAYTPLRVLLNGPDGPVNLFAAAVTPSLFPLLRTTPRVGRFFTAADAVDGTHGSVLLSHHAWTNRFGADPGILGAAVELNGEPYTVVGVFPDGFDFPHPLVELWTPLVVPPYEAPVDEGLGIRPALAGIGRLRPGLTPQQAAAEVRTLFDRAVDGRFVPPGLDLETRVTSLREERGRPFRPALLMLTAATGLVLLITCTNVAGLLLARGVVRQRELALRGALGAGRGQIVRQLLTESVVLSMAGGAAGLAVAAGLARIAPALAPPNVPGLSDVGLDATVLAFAAGLSVAVGLVFGTAPALVWSRVDLARTLNDGAAVATGGFGRLRVSRVQAVLVVAQVALALMLLTAGGLLLRSFVALVTIDLGFDPSNVVMARANDPAFADRFSRGGRTDRDEIEALTAAARSRAATLLMQLDRIANLPGVESVALSSGMPIDPAPSVRRFGVAGHPLARDWREQPQAGIRKVSPAYADVVGLRLRAGRFFTDRDGSGSQRVAVVSESFARAAFGGEPAVGQRLVEQAFPFPAFGRDDDADRHTAIWEVIGVVADVRSLRREPFRPDAAGDVYLSMLQPSTEQTLFIDGPMFDEPMVAVRTVGDPLAVVPFLREVVADVYPGALVDATALDTILSARAAQPRFYAAVAGIFAAVALLLAAFGIYSLLSYTVSQRRLEIGVRMALGAGNRAVILLVLRQGGALVVTGLVLGLLAAAAATHVIESLLFGIAPVDPLTFVAVTTVLLAVGLLACWLPARRAARIDPMDVLREA